MTGQDREFWLERWREWNDVQPSPVARASLDPRWARLVASGVYCEESAEALRP